MKKSYIVFAAVTIFLVGVGVGLYFVNRNDISDQGDQTPTAPVQNQESQPPANKPEDNKPAAEPQATAPENKDQTVIGKSVEGRDIVAYHFGSGGKEILFVGGIHGGYAWNTALLAYQIMDYLKTNPGAIPGNIKVTVVPVLNPDGLNKVVGVTGRFNSSDVSSSQDTRIAGRFNANLVDLNRNFDCGWKATGIWQNTTVSGGTGPFSEPESAAIRDYARAHKLTAVVAWYSAGGGVFSSSCGDDILPETQTITDIYAKASGYPAHKNFESYQVSGDATDWFAKNNVPAIGVLLSTYDNVEWDKNEAGIKALFEHYAN
jgi:hypothetical protein